MVTPESVKPTPCAKGKLSHTNACGGAAVSGVPPLVRTKVRFTPSTVPCGIPANGATAPFRHGKYVPAAVRQLVSNPVLVGRICAPSTFIVIAGVVFGLATEGMNPFAVTPDTVVTVPEPPPPPPPPSPTKVTGAG